MSKAKTTDPLDRKFTLDTIQGKSIRGKYLAKVANGSNVVKLDPEIAKAFPSADAVNAALASVIDQWRVCFCWGKHGPEDVEIVDYH